MTRPKTGGRISFLRAEGAGGAVVYRGGLYVPDAEWQGEARVDETGAVAFADWQPAAPPPPAWLVEYLRQFLRSEWRARQGQDAAPWPERITRWRAG